MPEHARHDDRAPEPVEPSNGSWRAWLVGALWSVLLIVGGIVLHTMDQRMTTIELYGSPAVRERVATIEARLADLDRRQAADLQRLSQAMERIEAKLDTALERLHSDRLGVRRPTPPAEP
jgi:hypothetical protein